jgi:threonylcarbamoyladenosine tRNA methylthiotransferase MtaB
MNDANHSPRVALDSLGCKLNQAEIEALARQLSRAGYRLVAPTDAADIYILNTCTVTATADGKSRKLLRAARRRNPHARLVAIGCYAERAPRELAAIEGVDLVLGNDRKTELPRLLGDGATWQAMAGQGATRPGEGGRRTRAFVKVQDGCHHFCTYCIVPFVRSREVSVPADEAVAQVGERAAAGYREVVLTGTEIGTYRHDGLDLAGLLERILAGTAIARLRLSSLQPPEITPGLVTLWRDPRLCPHFHLSLQSGSDAVLKRMNRRYTTAGYTRAVALIRKKVPDVAVTTDVIAGFPGETDAEFEETMNFCRGMRFARIHVFPYSPRPGTAAAAMSGQVSAAVKKERTRKMLQLAKESMRGFTEQYIGKTLEVLFERASGGLFTGLTGNYIKVYVRSRGDNTNEILPVRLTGLYRDGMRGEVG